MWLDAAVRVDDRLRLLQVPYDVYEFDQGLRG